MGLQIFPATDLHLLNTVSVSLRVFANAPTEWTDLSQGGAFTIQFTPQPAFINLSGLSLTATGTGSVVTRISLVDDFRHFNNSAPMRISVHKELRRLFVPVPKIELETGRTDRVLTVYGEFLAHDGSLITADITAHPFLRYHVDRKILDPLSPGPSPNLEVSADGRVNSGDNPGEVDIQISVDPALAQPAPMIITNVQIVPTVTDRPILNRFHSGTSIRKKSILFLPDGFTSAEQGFFEVLAAQIGRKLVQAISPYRHLKESFDMYSAFVASPEEGVTIGPPIISPPGPKFANLGVSLPMDTAFNNGSLALTDLLFNLGHPATSAAQTYVAAQTQLGNILNRQITATDLPRLLFDLWQTLRTQPPVSRVRETFFGIMIGARHGGSDAILEPSPLPPVPRWPPLDAAILLARGTIRTVLFDERRLPDVATMDPSIAHLPALSRFLKTLRVPGESDKVGDIWVQPTGDGTLTGDSFGLVVIIARADHYGGVSWPGCLLLSIGGAMLHNTVASTIVPRLLEVVPVPRPITKADSGRGFSVRPTDSLIDVVAHELAHSVTLGGLSDEYGDANRAPDLTNPAEVTFAEAGMNTQLVANAAAVPPGHGLVGGQIKWNVERVAGAARVATILAVGSEVLIGINDEDAGRWPAVAADTAFFLRGASLSGPRAGSLIAGSQPAQTPPQLLNFVSFDIGNQTIHCTPRGGATPQHVVANFPVGSVIYLPLKIGGVTVRMIPTALLGPLGTNGQFNPSAHTVGQNGEDVCTEVKPPVLPQVQRFVWPANQLQAIAAYDGGAKFNCGVIHPAGECKMKKVVDDKEAPIDFCYICKYTIVNAVNPGLLTLLESEYP